VTYKNGETWAEKSVKTTGQPAKLKATVDRTLISADGKDLAFITVRVTDENGLTVPIADNLISFSVKGPGEIIATDNGDPAEMTEFHSTERKAFYGLALVIIRSKKNKKGNLTVKIHSPGLEDTTLQISSK
jgi:beta-galactosidase